MKRWLMAAMITILSLIAFSMESNATTWKVANQVTVAWDAVTTLTDGTSIPAGSTIQYQVYIRTDPTGNSVASGNPITALQCLVTFAAEGFYDIGIKAQRVVAGQVVSESVIAWSNDPLVAQGGNDFGVQYYLSPAGIRNMR